MRRLTDIDIRLNTLDRFFIKCEKRKPLISIYRVFSDRIPKESVLSDHFPFKVCSTAVHTDQGGMKTLKG